MFSRGLQHILGCRKSFLLTWLSRSKGNAKGVSGALGRYTLYHMVKTLEEVAVFDRGKVLPGRTGFTVFSLVRSQVSSLCFITSVLHTEGGINF